MLKVDYYPNLLTRFYNIHTHPPTKNPLISQITRTPSHHTYSDIHKTGSFDLETTHQRHSYRTISINQLQSIKAKRLVYSPILAIPAIPATLNPTPSHPNPSPMPPGFNHSPRVPLSPHSRLPIIVIFIIHQIFISHNHHFRISIPPSLPPTNRSSTPITKRSEPRNGHLTSSKPVNQPLSSPLRIPLIALPINENNNIKARSIRFTYSTRHAK